ncbi:hypothetical protein F-M6_0082 [Faustovirus]|nr:hypothetical protein F-M6_0082 [Faustovirus]
MYTTICNLDSVIEGANTIVIDNDRKLYDDYRTATEKFVCENKAAIGGKYGVYLLTGRPLGREFITCDIYTDNAFDFGKRLCNELYKVRSAHIDSTLTYMMTEMRHLEFTIYVDTRPMVKVYRMDRYRGVDLMSVINFVKCPGFYYSRDDAAISVLPEELLLIDIYRSLHLPNRVGQWEDAWYLQDLLFKNYEEKLMQRTRGKSGGDDFNLSSNDGINKLNAAILKVLPVNALIVGDYAIKYHTGGPNEHSGKSRMRLQVVYESAQSLLDLINSKINIKLTMAEFKIPIPGDFQFLKYSFYANDGENNIAVMDIFNATSYEVVPGMIDAPAGDDKPTRGVNYAGIMPTLRYRFVDMWVMILIASMNKQSPNLNCLSNNILTLHRKMLELSKSNPQQLFPQTNDVYVGVVLNERVVKKRILKESGFRIPPYYPYAYFTNNPEAPIKPPNTADSAEKNKLPPIGDV